MVVEDEPDIYDVLLAMFEIWGIEGVAFVDGGEAVAWIESVDKGEVPGDLPELAILDIRLPEVSGPEIGARLRQSPRLRSIAIVLVTAYRMKPEDEAEARAKADADMLLYKPLPPMEEFHKMLDDLIVKRKAIAGQQPKAQPIMPSTVAKPVEPAAVAKPEPTKAAEAKPSDNKIMPPAAGSVNKGSISTGILKPPAAPKPASPNMPTPPKPPASVPPTSSASAIAPPKPPASAQPSSEPQSSSQSTPKPTPPTKPSP
jgi:CheY-like chemotaxis protein